MILSCPACATSFQIDDGHIGPDGRMVRCSMCRHTWKAQRAAEPIELKVTVKHKPETTEVLKEVKAKKLPTKYREIVEDQKRQKAMAAQAYVWATLFAGLLLVLGLAYVFRVDVVRTVPAFAGAYESLGLKVNGTNLEFESYSAESNFKGGRFVVTVKAKIVNLSNKPTPVPPVRARLYDASLGLFDTLTIGSEGLVIGPKATRTMIFDVKDPRNLTASLDLGFDLEALKRQSQHIKPKLNGHGVSEDHGSGHDAPHTTAHNGPAEVAHGENGGENLAETHQTVGAESPLRGTVSGHEPVAPPPLQEPKTHTEGHASTQDHTIRPTH